MSLPLQRERTTQLLRPARQRPATRGGLEKLAPAKISVARLSTDLTYNPQRMRPIRLIPGTDDDDDHHHHFGDSNSHSVRN